MALNFQFDISHKIIILKLIFYKRSGLQKKLIFLLKFSNLSLEASGRPKLLPTGRPHVMGNRFPENAFFDVSDPIFTPIRVPKNPKTQNYELLWKPMIPRIKIP